MSNYRYGKVFGDWKIEKEIGEGSDGTVYRIVKDECGIKDVSAMKAITIWKQQGKKEEISPKRLEEVMEYGNDLTGKALREVALMKKIRGNTNIVDMQDYKVVPWEEEMRFGNDLLIRMELLHNLETEQRKGRIFTEEEAVTIGKDICKALILCHSMGIIHRDIKPANIYWNDNGDYKLGDFGISKIVNDAIPIGMTRGKGTTAYIAPEQANSGNYDKRVDIYGLGLVLYELVNDNRLPFAKSTCATDEDVIRRIKFGTKLLPPEKAGKPLASVILKACEYDPKDRFQTAKEFLDALNDMKELEDIPKPTADIYATLKSPGSEDLPPKKDIYATRPTEDTGSPVETQKDMYKTLGCDNRVEECDVSYENEEEQAAFTNDEMKQLMDEAENGDRVSQYYLGVCYQSGMGVEEDLEKAAEWYLKSAENGYAEAQNLIANCYMLGYGVAVDNSEAVRWFLSAATQGNGAAQCSMGGCYEHGIGVEKDMKEAVRWYRMSAEQGDPIGQYYMGRCYQYGKGMKENSEQAVKWYKLAADAGDAEAICSLAHCYNRGYGMETRDIGKAFELYMKAAKLGNCEAQNMVGYGYFVGRVVEQNYSEAVKWFKRSAEQGSAKAQCNLGICLQYGYGVEQDYDEAIRFLKMSAEHGHVKAQRQLGLSYYNGIGIDVDYDKAAGWFEKAAEAGNAPAQFDLGYCYETGTGKEQDLQKALMWYERSAANGYAAAKEKIETLRNC